MNIRSEILKLKEVIDERPQKLGVTEEWLLKTICWALAEALDLTEIQNWLERVISMVDLDIEIPDLWELRKEIED